MAPILIALALLVGLGVVAGNALVAAVLRSSHHAWLSGRVLLLTLPPDARGSTRTLPVDYRRDAEDPGLVRVASDFSWWRAIQPYQDEGSAEVALLIAGQRCTGRARIIDEREAPQLRLEGLKKLRPATWRRAVARGSVLIEIRLDGGDPVSCSRARPDATSAAGAAASARTRRRG